MIFAFNLYGFIPAQVFQQLFMVGIIAQPNLYHIRCGYNKISRLLRSFFQMLQEVYPHFFIISRFSFTDSIGVLPW